MFNKKYVCVLRKFQAVSDLSSNISLFVSLQFFMFILIIFLAELAAAILAFIFREHVSITRRFF